MIVAAVRRGGVRFAKDAGAGGLLVALAKGCVRGGVGAEVVVPAAARVDWQLFGEGSGLAWLAMADGDVDAVLADARAAGVPAIRAGVTGGSALRVRAGNSSVVDVTGRSVATSILIARKGLTRGRRRSVSQAR